MRLEDPTRYSSRAETVLVTELTFFVWWALLRPAETSAYGVNGTRAWELTERRGTSSAGTGTGNSRF